MESIFRNIDSLEESHVNISKLIDQLEIESRQDNGEVHQLITGMDSMLNQVGDNHFELQREIEELLESSRRGALSHEKLADMIHAEQVRSNYLTNIVSSLKSQIEGLFTKLVVVTEDEDSVSNPGEIVEQVSDNVNLLWKSVDSLSKLISSPTKKLEYNIQKIDSEVIVHLNKTLHLHDRQSAPTLESFPEKMETQVKAVKKKIEKKNSVPNAPNMGNYFFYLSFFRFILIIFCL
jgi:predicted  nucleic acid-binding Zn-ribbon protein